MTKCPQENNQMEKRIDLPKHIACHMTWSARLSIKEHGGPTRLHGLTQNALWVRQLEEHF